MNEATQITRKYLDPTVLARVGNLELRARLIVEGLFSGMHRSPSHGLSIEFADHRAYAQGDDIRHIDWKVYGKTDKYYIKEYEQESNLILLLLVDHSESMEYRSSETLMSKRAYADCIASTIAFLALRQQDSVGIATFGERIEQFIAPHNNPHHWMELVKALDRSGAAPKTNMAQVLDDLAERLRHRALVLVISDLLDEPESFLAGLHHLRSRHHELAVFQVWDPAELTFPLEELTRFEGLEAGGEILADPRGLRARYLEEIQRFQADVRSHCSELQADYFVFNTADPLDLSLSTYLATRSMRMRRRSSRVLGRG